ncbi:MAG: S8 family serine peptidase [Candidatus Edwardsbacteria bacterium]|nr:S8 family serine peptidase [Candidatus Edwardsbacteria bacterium]
MKRRIVSTLLAMVIAAELAAAAAITPALEQRIRGSKSGEQFLCWVSFADKGAAKAFPALESKALDRRRKLGRALSYGDRPVDPAYIAAVKAAGATVRTASPWLNAVSVSADRTAIASIARLSYVAEIDVMPVYHAVIDIRGSVRRPDKKIPSLDYGLAEEQIRLMRIDELHRKGYTGSGVRLAFLDTGFDRQHEALRRTRVIAERDFQRMLYDTVSHVPLVVDTLPDSITSFERDQDTSMVQTWHGTGMLSIAGAYKAGSLIGSAYNADFILAKTEHIHSRDEPDFYREEDWWIAGLQWAADSAGADIVSSSLAYKQFSDTTGYTYAEMDGNAARASKAADSAASRGVLVLNAIGNVSSSITNPNIRPDTCILVPADGDSVLTVGGVWSNTRQWVNTNSGSGAATGPTADSVKIQRLSGSDSVMIRRIKPDIASAFQNWYAYNEPDAQGNYNLIYAGVGTSGATALTAGLCALLLEAHPSWGPREIIAALKYSGSNRGAVETFLAHPESLNTALGTAPNYNPDFAGIATGHKYYNTGSGVVDFYDVYRIGWGIPDGVAALNYTEPEVIPPEEDALLDPYPNPAKPGNAKIYFPYFLSRDSYAVTLRLYTLDGRLVRQIELGQQLAGQYPSQMDRAKRRTGGSKAAVWDLKDSKGNAVPGGMYLALLTTGWNQSSKKVVVLR